MPCRYDGPTIDYAEIDKLTRMLCGILRESRGDKDTDYIKDFLSKETIEWWNKHKEADAKRREQEAYDKQMAEKVEFEKYKKLKAKYENGK